MEVFLELVGIAALNIIVITVGTVIGLRLLGQLHKCPRCEKYLTRCGTGIVWWPGAPDDGIGVRSIECLCCKTHSRVILHSGIEMVS